MMEIILTGTKRKTWRKTYPSATLSTTVPTWTDPGAIPALRGEKPDSVSGERIESIFKVEVNPEDGLKLEISACLTSTLKIKPILSSKTLVNHV
jgi:hypothetical protein